MNAGLKTVIYPVKDLAGAKRLFSELLGSPPSVDEPYYVGFELNGQHIGLDPHGHDRGMTGPVGYWHVSDIAASLAALVEAGAVVAQPVTEVGGGKLIATARDADRNVIGLVQMPG